MSDTKKKVIWIILTISILFFPGESQAAPNCTSPPDCEVTGTIGNIGGSLSFNNLGTFDTRFDTIRFTSLNDYSVYVGGDSRISAAPYQIWEHVYFGDAGLTSNINVKFYGSILESYNMVLDANYSRTVGTSQLNLNHVNLETDPELFFSGSDNQINLSSSGIYFSDQEPEFISTAPLTINVLAGDNYLKNFNGRHSPSSTSINLRPGTSLLFDYCGSISFSATDIEKLYFYTPVTGTVDNATLKLHYSNVNFNSSSFNFTNSSIFELTGSQTQAEFVNVSFDTSQITLGNSTTVKARELNLDNTTLTINPGARVDVSDSLTVTGTTTLSGSDLAGSGLYAYGFDLKDNATFNNIGSRVSVTDFILGSGSQLNINSGQFSAETTLGIGGTVDVTNGGLYAVTGGFYYTSRNAVFNIDATSHLTIGSSGEMTLGPLLSVNNNGTTAVYGYLSGRGTIAGSGEVVVHESGQISPGTFITANNLIDTITFENAVTFINAGALGNQSQSQYYAHIDVVGGTETNDLLQYNDNDFTTTNLTSIKVDTASSKTADDLHGKHFTIVASSNAGSTGSVVTGGSYPAIVEGADIPALIDFTISNENTNGNDDITLNSYKQGVSSILKHPSITRMHRAGTTTTSVPAPGNPSHTTTTVVQIVPQSNGTANQMVTVTTTNSNNAVINTSTATTKLGKAHGSSNKTAAANLLTSSANAGNTTIQGHLNALQNSHVNNHFDSIHAEPFSSYMTVSLEQNDLFLDTALSNATRHENHVYSSRNHVVTDMDTQRRFWLTGSYVDGDVDGENDLGSFDYTLSNLVIGTDLWHREDLNLGTFFGTGRQDMNEHDHAIQDFRGTSYHLGFYGSKQLSNWQLKLAVGYGYGDHRSTRQVKLGTNLSGENSADFDSHSVYTGLKARYTSFYKNDWLSLSPTASLLYSHYNQGQVTESGVDALALTVDSASAESIITGIGLDAVFKPLGKTQMIYPISFIRYEKDWEADNNDAHKVTAALSSHPDQKHDFFGQNRGSNIWTAGIGVASHVSSQLRISGGMVGGWNSNGSELAAGLSLQYDF